MNESRGRVLIVSYFFPPDVGPGSQRVAAIARHLDRRGWEVTVLTTGQLALGYADASAAALPPRVRVIRTGVVDVYGAIHRAAASGKQRSPGIGRRAARLARKTVKLAVYPVYALARFPDKQVGWVPHLVRRIRRIVAEEGIDVVVSSGPPHSTHLGVMLALRGRGVRWIADFRDPWTAPLRNPRRGGFHRVQRWLERRVLSRCDHVIANTPGNQAALMAAFPEVPPERVTVVTNGFEPPLADLPTVDPEMVACDLVYTGEVYDGMTDVLIPSMERLAASGADTAPRIHLFGAVEESERRRIESSAVSQRFRHFGFVPSVLSIAIGRAAPALLLLLPHADRWQTCVPSKLYPYLFAGRPVLALVPSGDAARIVERSGVGVAVTTADPVEAAEAIAAFVARVRDGREVAQRRPEVVAEYAMETLVARVERLIAAGPTSTGSGS